MAAITVRIITISAPAPIAIRCKEEEDVSLPFCDGSIDNWVNQNLDREEECQLPTMDRQIAR